jgi:hypothetical protein
VLGLTSRVGQVDYSAANAFLDAFAHYKTSKGNPVTISIDWDGWEEVGMAVDNSLPSQAGASHPASLGREIDHPLLDRLVLHTPDRLVYRTDFRVYKHWVLNEHRILGTAALPGTAYLEMARAAYKLSHRERIEIANVYFLATVARTNRKPCSLSWSATEKYAIFASSARHCRTGLDRRYGASTPEAESLVWRNPRLPS